MITVTNFDCLIFKLCRLVIIPRYRSFSPGIWEPPDGRIQHRSVGRTPERDSGPTEVSAHAPARSAIDGATGSDRWIFPRSQRHLWTGIVNSGPGNQTSQGLRSADHVSNPFFKIQPGNENRLYSGSVGNRGNHYLELHGKLSILDLNCQVSIHYAKILIVM